MSTRYEQKRDSHGNGISEAIKGFKTVMVDVSALKTDYSVSIPKFGELEPYGVIFNVLDETIKLKAKFNDSDYLSITGAGQYSPFIDNIDSLLLSTEATSLTMLEIVFIY